MTSSQTLLYFSWAAGKRLWLRRRSFSHKLQSDKRTKSTRLRKQLRNIPTPIAGTNETAEDHRMLCSPWCKRFCWGTWWTSPDTRSSTSSSTLRNERIHSAPLEVRGHNTFMLSFIQYHTINVRSISEDFFPHVHYQSTMRKRWKGNLWQHVIAIRIS